MSRLLRRTKQVARDMVGIFEYVHARSPQAADHVLEAIWHSLQALVDMPGVGRRWESRDPRLQGMRVTVVTRYRNYVIFFRPTSTTIEAYRVVHGAQDLERIVDEIDLDFANDN